MIGSIKVKIAKIKNQANCMLETWEEVYKNADTLITDVEGVQEEFELSSEFVELEENILRGYKVLTIDSAVREYVETVNMMADSYEYEPDPSPFTATYLDPEIFA